MIAPVALAGLISTCAPSLDARTAAALVAVESRGEPYAIADATTKRSYFPSSLTTARTLVDQLAGHELAVGIAQVDRVNFARFKVDARGLFDPCRNLRVGSQLLAEDYRREYALMRAASQLVRRQTALRRAFSAYNSGSPTRAAAYAKRVVDATATPLVRRVTMIADAAAPKEGARPRRAPRVARARQSAARLISASTVFVGTATSSAGTAFVTNRGR